MSSGKSKVTGLGNVLVPVVGTIVVAIIGYYGIRTTTYAPIWATQTAQAGSIILTQTFSSIPTDLSASPESSLSLTDTPETTKNAEPPSFTPEPLVRFLAPHREELSLLPTMYVGYVDSKKPAINTYNIALQSNQSYFWSYRWCARYQATLDENLRDMTFGFLFDDAEISESNFLIYQTRIQNGWECQVWTTILKDLQQGQTLSLSVLYSMSRPIFDGNSTYQPGNYRHNLTITVN